MDRAVAERLTADAADADEEVEAGEEPPDVPVCCGTGGACSETVRTRFFHFPLVIFYCFCFIPVRLKCDRLAAL